MNEELIKEWEDTGMWKANLRRQKSTLASMLRQAIASNSQRLRGEIEEMRKAAFSIRTMEESNRAAVDSGYNQALDDILNKLS